MNLDIKGQVLLAIYKECQKDSPNMDSITFASLGIPEGVFLNALVLLDNEGLVKALRFPGAGARSAHPAAVEMREARISPAGIEYVEGELLVRKMPIAKEKG